MLLFFTFLVVFVAVWLLQEDNIDPVSIKNSRVLITEASFGIGAQIAYQYALHGAELVLIAANKSDLYPVAYRCKELGADKVEILVGDLYFSKVRSAVFRRIGKHSDKLDVVVLNHGYFRSKGSWSGNGDDLVALYEDMNLNLFSYVDLMSKCRKFLSSDGRVAILTTLRSRMGIAGLAAESATRFALRGFSLALRQEMTLLQRSSFSVTLCYLGVVDDDSSREVGDVFLEGNDDLESSGGVANLSALSSHLSAAAVAVISSVTNKRYEMYYPRRGRIIALLQFLFPEFVDSRFIKTLADY